MSDALGDCLAQQVSETVRGRAKGVAKEEERERENKKRQKQSRSRGTAVYRKGTFRRRAASTEEESLVQFSHLLFCFHVKSSLPVACVDVTVSASYCYF